MKKLTYLGLALLLAAFLGSAAWAQFDLTKSIGVGAKGPFWAPLMSGSDYPEGREPYLMGLLGGVQFKYGLNENIMVGVSGAYGLTYDDTTGTDDKGFSFYSKDNASVKLTGFFIDVTGWYYFMPESNIRPFVLAGVGINLMKLKTEPGGVEEASYSDLVGKGGAGVEFFVAERIGINVGARFNYLLIYVQIEDAWTDEE
ncbi:MAG: outer membrane beta-barrel protein, partial [Candidatus Zixiibacteriota bacterium]